MPKRFFKKPNICDQGWGQDEQGGKGGAAGLHPGLGEHHPTAEEDAARFHMADHLQQKASKHMRGLAGEAR